MTKSHEGVGVRIALASSQSSSFRRSSPVLAPASPVASGLRGALIAAVAAAVLAGCASPHPAPIVRREPVPATKTPAPPPATVAPAPAPAPAPAAQEPGPIVEPVRTEPIRSTAIQSRSLSGAPGSEARPLSPTAPPIAGGPIRTEPSAAKQPYSEALLAKLRQSAPPPGPQAAAKPEPLKPEPLKPEPDKPVSSAGAPSAQGFIWPASGPVIQRFAEPRSMGVSIAGKAGDPVVAAADGRVIFSGKGPRGYGNLLIVKHDASDTLSVYAHNRALLVKEGANVKRGQRIAEMGDTDADRTKLHFEIRKGGKPVDPSDYLPSR